MSIVCTLSTLSVRGGFWAVSTVSPNVNQVLMSVLDTVSTLSMRTCDYVRVQTATEWTASVPVIGGWGDDNVRVQSAT